MPCASNQLRIDPLEPRRLLVAAGLDGGVLAIDGTDAPERLAIRLVNDQIQVLTGALLLDIVDQFDPADVESIEVSGKGGNDEIRNELLEGDFDGFVTLRGGAGNDAMTTSFRFDRLFGEDGNDTLTTTGGVALMFGGPGSDTLTGGAGRDALFGEGNNDLLRGGDAGDFLDGGDGSDILEGGAGDDTVDGGLGPDSLAGGAGIDLVSYMNRTEGVFIVLGQGGNGANSGTENDIIADDVEDALGGSGNDNITGTNGRNYLLGGAGNDFIFGLDGKDTLEGGEGNDRLDGGDDFDWLLDLDGDVDLLIGGGGADVSLGDLPDDEEQVETITNSIEEFLASI